MLLLKAASWIDTSNGVVSLLPVSAWLHTKCHHKWRQRHDSSTGVHHTCSAEVGVLKLSCFSSSGFPILALHLPTLWSQYKYCKNSCALVWRQKDYPYHYCNVAQSLLHLSICFLFILCTMNCFTTAFSLVLYIFETSCNIVTSRHWIISSISSEEC